MRVVAGPGDDVSVSIGPFVSETDELERDRDKQETRRLLYVALTRARDRLYLCSALKDGAFAPGPGSLGDVLPESIRALFPRAATAFEELPTIAWTGASGHTFELLRCSPPSNDAAPIGTRAAPRARPYVSARAPQAAAAVAPVTESGEAVEPDRALVGRLVHRLFEFVRADAADALDAASVRDLLTAEERSGAGDVDAVVADALRAWHSLRRGGEVERVLRDGACLHEVPFSLFEPATSSTVRGTIDCLVRRPDGSLLVLELKTGGRRRDHDRQLETYVRAARALFPDSRVDGLLLYA